jgi:hypothetical protein
MTSQQVHSIQGLIDGIATQTLAATGDERHRQ